MREIKFRGWNKRYKRMDSDFIHLELNKSYIEYHDLILMQYTGLKDKNGLEIYEGDILKTRVHKTYSINLEVIWNEDRCCFEMNKRYENTRYDFTCDTMLDWDCEVIGNIHENKELLND